jgi:hypothetical protein
MRYAEAEVVYHADAGVVIDLSLSDNAEAWGKQQSLRRWIKYRLSGTGQGSRYKTRLATLGWYLTPAAGRPLSSYLPLMSKKRW